MSLHVKSTTLASMPGAALPEQPVGMKPNESIASTTFSQDLHRLAKDRR
jgi:hypothetical protein